VHVQHSERPWRQPAHPLPGSSRSGPGSSHRGKAHPIGMMSPSPPGAKVRRSSGAEEGSAVSNEAYSRAGRRTSVMAVGFILFAAIMMLMVGVFQALQGLVAIF